MGPQGGSGKDHTAQSFSADLTFHQPAKHPLLTADEITPHCPRASLHNGAPRHVGFIFQMYNLIPVADPHIKTVELRCS